MRLVVLASLPFLLASTAASAGAIDGNGALSLAALVAQSSPLVKPADKQTLLKLLNAQKYGGGEGRVAVAAHSLVCKVGDVDITLHACDLVFAGDKKVALSGRAAHELYATLAEIGVPSDGAAGTLIEGVSNLSCEIDPAGVKKQDGGGARCTYDPAK